MKCHIHGGSDVGKNLLVKHHVHPQGFGGPDVPSNIVFICASCHDLLHKIAEALYSKNQGKATDLANQYLPNDPRRRSVLLKLSTTAATAKRDYLEKNPNYVPEDPSEGEIEERTIQVALHLPESLHQRLKVKASDYTHPKTGRKVGLYRYIEEILKAHVEMENITSTRQKIKVTSKEWDIL